MDDLSKLESLLDDSGSVVEPAANPADTENAGEEGRVADAPESSGKPEPDEAKPAEVVDEPKYKVKIDGQESEVPLSELLKGYQRQADYTNKTQQVADERRSVETEKEKLQREREEFVQGATTEMWALRQQLETDAKKDWQALLNRDPVEYMRQKADADARREKYFQLRQQSDQVVNALQQEQQEQLSAQIAKESQILKDTLPQFFGDEAKAAETRKQLREFMVGNGFAEAEIANVVSARDVRLLLNAMRYDQLEKAKVADAKRVKESPPRVESSDAKSDDSGSRLNKSAMERLRKSGGRDSDAAMRAIESLL